MTTDGFKDEIDLFIEAMACLLMASLSSCRHLPQVTRDDLAAAATIVDRCRDQDIGVADASIVVLADRFATREILTLDHRHFNVLRPLTGGRFKLVPAAP